MNVLKPSKNDSNELNNDEGTVLKETISNDDKIIHENYSMNVDQLNQNNETLNSESYQEQQATKDLCQTPLKTSSRPQRQAAKKAENQIRVNNKKKETIKF